MNTCKDNNISNIGTGVIKRSTKICDEGCSRRPADTPAVEIIFAGDACFRGREGVVDRQYSSDILADIKPFLTDSDYRIINLENPLTPEGEGTPIFKGGPNLTGLPQNVGFLEEGGFNCAVLANNHIGDYGPDSIRSTIRILKEHNIACAGAGENLDEAYKALHIDIKGIGISVIACAENEYGGALANRPGSAMYQQGRLSSRIKEEKRKSDFVIVCFHGGNEYNPFPSPQVIERYRSFCDCGADAVIAGHTHCPQGYEYYNTKPIIYSMGNFYFPALSKLEPDSSWYYGYMSKLTLVKGKMPLFEAIPYRFDTGATRITPFAGEKLEGFRNYLDGISAVIANPEMTERFYAGWCALKGPGLAKLLRSKPEYLEKPDISADAEAKKTLFYFRSLFNCEAHRELMAKFFRLVCESRLNEALQYAEELKEYMKMSV
ncbi:MAG: CapA family protein [Eubacteriales bacterium]|nr:CapA family protein [Eubacteriales bacterium]